MSAIAAALATACCWGIADFLGGIRARRMSWLALVWISHCYGLAIMAALVLLSGGVELATESMTWSVGAGVAAGGAAFCLYGALAIGPISVVAPISALGSGLPVVAGILGGDQLDLLQSVGIPVTLFGVTLAALAAHPGPPPVERLTPRSAVGIRLAVVAACLIGFTMYAWARAADLGASSVAVVGVARAADVVVLSLAVGVTRPVLPRVRQTGVLLALGVLESMAILLFTFATTQGALSVVSVISAVYPVVTIALSVLIMGERLRCLQAVGVVTAFIGLALLVSG